jgi:small GTP-binding protein
MVEADTLRRFLSTNAEAILRQERQLMLSLRGLLDDLEAAPTELTALDRALLQLDELFLLVVVGEYNSGKSAFINALMGRRLLQEGVTPTTTQVHRLRFGPESRIVTAEGDFVTVQAPVDWLRDINLVDTPGTNAVILRHQEITEDYVPRADLVLFVTSADRPFSESERAFLSRIREWGKKVIIVLNKVDLFSTEAELAQVTRFIEEHARELLGLQPQIFSISARAGLQAKESADPALRARLWADSRMEPLESYILTTLDARERLRLKLANPLGIAKQMARRGRVLLESRQALLREDVVTVKTIEDELVAYEGDMRRDFSFRLSAIDNELYAMAERGNRFFDETIRLTRVFDLARPERVRAQFQEAVVADTAARIDAHAQELIDWMVSADLQQWQGITNYLNRRMARRQEDLVGWPAGEAPERLQSGFAYHRRELLETVGRAAREVVERYNPKAQTAELAESLQRAVAQTALIEIGALGLGALLVKVLALTVADITGLLAAGAVAALGLYVIPYKRKQAKHSLEQRIGEVRQHLATTMTDQFHAEISRSVKRIRDAIRPYTRFVESHQSRLVEIARSLHDIDAELDTIEGRLTAEF